MSGGFQGHAIKIRIFLGGGRSPIASAHVTSLPIVQSRAVFRPLRLLKQRRWLVALLLRILWQQPMSGDFNAQQQKNAVRPASKTRVPSDEFRADHRVDPSSVDPDCQRSLLCFTV